MTTVATGPADRRGILPGLSPIAGGMVMARTLVSSGSLFETQIGY
jgi:hypothetical protein